MGFFGSTLSPNTPDLIGHTEKRGMYILSECIAAIKHLICFFQRFQTAMHSGRICIRYFFYYDQL